MADSPTSPDRDNDRFCGGKKRQGEGFCTRPAGWGTDHVGVGRCKLHGGGTPSHRVGARRRLQAQAVEGQIGALLAELELDAADVHPVEVILDAVRRAWAMVQVLGALVGEIDRGGLWGPDHLDDARPHVATEMYRVWLADAGRLSKLALDAGVDERRVRLAESQGEQLAGVVRGILGGLAELLLAAGVDGALVRSLWEERVPGLVRAELAAVVGGEGAGEIPSVRDGETEA